MAGSQTQDLSVNPFATMSAPFSGRALISSILIGLGLGARRRIEASTTVAGRCGRIQVARSALRTRLSAIQSAMTIATAASMTTVDVIAATRPLPAGVADVKL